MQCMKLVKMHEAEEGQQCTNVRQRTTLIGDTPGEFVQGPDGRIAFIYCHRYDPQAGVYARGSRDAGRTWDPSLLALRTAPCGGYPSSTVFGDGTILTLTGFSEEGRVQAIRWRCPMTKRAPQSRHNFSPANKIPALPGTDGSSGGFIDAD